MSDSDPVDPMLEAVLARIGQGRGRQSDLRRMMKRHYRVLRRRFEEHGPHWSEFVAALNEQGMRTAIGGEISVRRAQQTWYQVCKEMGAKAAARGGEPRPKSDLPAEPAPAVPVSPPPSRNSTRQFRTEELRDEPEPERPPQRIEHAKPKRWVPPDSDTEEK